jgi:hypothetical protein
LPENKQTTIPLKVHIMPQKPYHFLYSVLEHRGMDSGCSKSDSQMKHCQQAQYAEGRPE